MLAAAAARLRERRDLIWVDMGGGTGVSNVLLIHPICYPPAVNSSTTNQYWGGNLQLFSIELAAELQQTGCVPIAPQLQWLGGGPVTTVCCSRGDHVQQ